VDHVGAGRADRVAVDALRLNVRTTSALERLIKPTDDDPRRDEHGHPEPPQQPTGTKR
jgi:hypothetical protein